MLKVRKSATLGSVLGLLLGACGVLALASACGKNPELFPHTEGFEGRAELGEPCAAQVDCAQGLLCGPNSVCTGSCGEPRGNGCGVEACLPSGLCSEGLGRDCKRSSSCSDGLTCSSLGHCAVPCAPGGVECKGGASCRADGTCPTDRDVVLGVGGQDGGGGDPIGTGGAASCIDVDVDFEPQVPTVLLLIDRSYSMNNEAGFGAAVKAAVDAGTYALGDCPKDNDWRWNVVRDVLMNPAKGIIKPLEERVRFGLSLYSSDNGRVDKEDAEKIDPAKSCPVLIDVPIALKNHQSMLDQFKCSDIFNDTPTGESLVAAATTLKAFTEPGPKVIVLATDGEPDNCECPNFGKDFHVPAKCKLPGVADQVKKDVVATAQQIHGEDVTIHIINVSTPSNAGLQQHLKEVADAGGGQVYEGFSPGALTDAFEDIINGVRSCAIDLNGEISPGKEATGKVTLDGEELVLNGKDGWQVNTPSQIELRGAACEAIKSGGHELAIRFPCDSFDPVVQ